MSGWRLVLVGEHPKQFKGIPDVAFARFVEAWEALITEMGATSVDVRFEDLDGNPLGRRPLKDFP